MVVPPFPTGFHVSRGTLDPAASLHDTGLSPSVAGLPMPFSNLTSGHDVCPNPEEFPLGLASSAFARHY